MNPVELPEDATNIQATDGLTVQGKSGGFTFPVPRESDALSSGLLERRRDMVRSRAMGVQLVDVVKELSAKYRCSKRALYHDWQRRREWMGALLDIGDRDLFFLEIVANHRELYRLAALQYLQGDNSSAKIGALRLLRELNLDVNGLAIANGLGEWGEASRKVDGPLDRGEVLHALGTVLDRAMKQVEQGGGVQRLDFYRIATQACVVAEAVLRDGDLDELKARVLRNHEEMELIMRHTQGR